MAQSTVYITDGEVSDSLESYGSMDRLGPSTLTPERSASGPNYNYNGLVFPGDIGQSFMGHWMKININVPVKDSGTPTGSDQTLSFINPRILPNDKSTLDTARAREGNAFTPMTGVGNAVTNVTGGLSSILNQFGAPSIPERNTFAERRTRRITDTIILAMPNHNIVFNSENDYENVALTFYGAAGLAAAGAATAGGLFGAAAGIALYKITNAAGQVARQATTLAGYPINPRLEILFTGRKQRQFAFEFLLSPTNQQEENAIKRIIFLLRYHSSPDIIGGGYFFVPPAEFDISFFFNGRENPSVPKVSTCALERIEVDYSPQGAFSTFSTGHPVQIRLSLGFREIEVLHKARVAQGF